MDHNEAGVSESGSRNRVRLVSMARRPDSSADLKAILTGIGTALRTHLSEVLREPIPDRMTELLNELDKPQRTEPSTPDK